MNKKLCKEILIDTAIIGIFSVLALLIMGLGGKFKADLVTVSYSADKSLNLSKTIILKSFLIACAFFVAFVTCLFLVKPSGIKPVYGKGWVAAFSVFAFFGVLAYTFLVSMADGLGIGYVVSAPISMAITLVYLLLIYKLYFEGKANSNAYFWEIFRFALVGLTAAVVDFVIAFSVQFYAFNGHIGWFVTAVSTACGFIGGVIINYVLSTYMVYKSAKTNFSKSVFGIILFLVLSVVGLLIGIGLQYLLYDCLYLGLGVKFFTYPTDFVIRTLIVMVYNYISRKFIIYK